MSISNQYDGSLGFGDFHVWDFIGLSEEEAAEPVDANGDGFITYEETITSADTESVETRQQVFIAAKKIEYMSYVNGVATFKVWIDETKAVTMNITASPNFPDIRFYGTDYVDMTTLGGWPEELLRHCYDNDDAVTFYDHVHADEATIDEILSVIDNYDDVVADANFDAAWAVVTGFDPADGDLDTTLSAETAREYYRDAINGLYGWIDNTDTDKGMIGETWSGIIQTWITLGLSDADIGALIQALVLGVTYQGSLKLFQTFFTPVLATLEGFLETDKMDSVAANDIGLDAVDKMVILLLETQSPESATTYGGATIWDNGIFATETTDENGEIAYTAGAWYGNAENIAAIELYQSVLAQSPWALATGFESDVIAREEGVLEQADAQEEAGPRTALIRTVLRSIGSSTCTEHGSSTSMRSEH